jgi:hypothetical protein
VKRFLQYGFLLMVIVTYQSCKEKKSADNNLQAQDVTGLVTNMSSLMIHDITNPPLAARFFAYSFLAGYEVIAQNDSAYKSMYGVLNNYPAVKKPAVKNYSYQLASLFAVLETTGKLQPSGKLLDSVKLLLIDSSAAKGINADIIKASKQYGEEVAKEILNYARNDGYRNISEYPRYTPREGEGYWYPTPPGFFAAVEPYFNKLRPFIIDSASQFKPDAPVSFSTKKGSPFYLLMDSVYQTSTHLTDEQKAIASFWDCNPFAMEDDGHLRVGIKKISPGAHWMGIAGIACKKENFSFNKTMQVHAFLAATLMDAFICCWDEKYRSHRIRPETAIRKIIDPSWMPLLQTPPFPEYLSGHSVISAASAEILSDFFGNDFSYTDDVEVAYGLPARAFQSFRQAAAEAGISRFYGGIHFMDAVRTGLQQGKSVGGFILSEFTANK